jgi:hypothetical protein
VFLLQSLKTSIRKRAKNYRRSLLIFLQLQLFITLISWPILLSWGLPISLAGFIGNFIFSPFLMLFLLLSALIFFSELCGLPNTSFIALLELLTSWWLKLIMLGSRSWLIAFAKPSLIVFLALLASTGFALHHKKFIKTGISVLVLTFFLCAWLCFFYFQKPTGAYTKQISCFEKELIFIRSHKKSILIDPGILGRRVSAPSWVFYTLVPELIKTEGITHIDYLILLKSSPMTFNAVAALCQKLSVDHVYLVNWSGSLSHHGWYSWEKLLSTLNNYHSKLSFIDKSLTLALDNGDTLTLIPTQKTVKRNKLSYPEVFITAMVNSRRIDIQPY